MAKAGPDFRSSELMGTVLLLVSIVLLTMFNYTETAIKEEKQTTLTCFSVV